MRKKVYKYIKFLVSMVLILGLIAPSYASLSASDGSAFVTKAEFDSALADLNSRLATFEAGINSKIDSQVTSYLDRNGIWNGKEQKLTDIGDGGKLTTNVNSFTYYLWKKQGATNNWGGDIIKNLRGSYYTEQYKIIEKINKSGLLYLVWQVNNIPKGNTKPEKPTFSGSIALRVPDSTLQWENMYEIGCGFAKKENTIDIGDYFNYQSLYTGIASATTGGQSVTTPATKFGIPIFSGTSMFFVQTNDAIFFTFLILASTPNNTNAVLVCKKDVANNTVDAYFHSLAANVY